MKPTVVLIGPPGAGKSTTAAAVAEALRLDVRDTDEDIELAEGRPIAEIFIDAGEAYFRELEAAAVQTALAEHAGVLALGGGAVLSETTRERLAGHRVVFLDVSLAEASKRVGMSAARPLLIGNVRSQLKQLMDHRRPLYESVARHTVETDHQTPAEVAARVISLVEDDR